ncbi:MAG: excinuclease ABC subunit UvrB [Armatimonadetes bacterium]|nr:excinuclease ABC subunit UvrB [Armatimonadota bacterium]
MPEFKIKADYQPTGDQPRAIEQLTDGVKAGHKFQTLLGVTGSGKTFTMANIVQAVQKPTLVLAHNKTLAAQLCSEFREFFPDNAVEYFVSYYDYYLPEAYVPQTDTYIEKDSSVNDEIDRLRHSATQSVIERRDVLVVASVSCIFGIGSKESYSETVLNIRVGDVYERQDILRRLINMQFTRNDIALGRGTFRVRGDVLEIQPIDEEVVTRIGFFGDEVEKISVIDPITGEVLRSQKNLTVFPATHFVSSVENIERSLVEIEQELEDRVRYFEKHGRLLEAQRIQQRTRFDMEMLRELGYCNGIENYSRIIDGRAPGSTPHTLVEYFPDDFLLFIDESHQTIPQLHGMHAGDRSRKEVLVEYGFRLPSALDNRPLRFSEFEKLVNQAVFVSATPGPYEVKHSTRVAEQLIRPTGLLDPEVEVKPTAGQIDDLIDEIKQRTERQERVLVTTLTKKMAEDLSAYLLDLGIKVNYLHSEIKTIERTEILRDLRLGVHDAIVGINLLREGLDLPEVSLVAVLDADKEGFLRDERSLIQTMGRAARNVSGKVILYADNVTESMRKAMEETNRRRKIQMEYNEQHGITPTTIAKAIRDLIDTGISDTATGKPGKLANPEALALDELLSHITQMERDMKRAAKNLDFERAAELRDEIASFKKFLPDASWRK